MRLKLPFVVTHAEQTSEIGLLTRWTLSLRYRPVFVPTQCVLPPRVRMATAKARQVRSSALRAQNMFPSVVHHGHQYDTGSDDEEEVSLL